MKYCINYYGNFRYLNEIDEIIFDYTGVGDILNFIQEKIKPEQRVLLSLVHAEDLDALVPIVDRLKEIHPNYTIILKKDQLTHRIKDNHPFFLGEYCKTFDQVYSFIELDVTDIYIVETLGFSIKDMGTYAHEHNVKVRVLPNVAQSTLGSLSQLPHECRFFIRPEDVSVYEPYVDVFELFGDNHKLSVTYEIYKEGNWKGALGNLIKGLPLDFSLDAQSPYGEYRLNCGQKCYKCKMCTVHKELNDIMDQNNLRIIKEKEYAKQEKKEEI